MAKAKNTKAKTTKAKSQKVETATTTPPENTAANTTQREKAVTSPEETRDEQEFTFVEFRKIMHDIFADQIPMEQRIDIMNQYLVYGNLARLEELVTNPMDMNAASSRIKAIETNTREQIKKLLALRPELVDGTYKIIEVGRDWKADEMADFEHRIVENMTIIFDAEEAIKEMKAAVKKANTDYNGIMLEKRELPQVKTRAIMVYDESTQENVFTDIITGREYYREHAPAQQDLSDSIPDDDQDKDQKTKSNVDPELGLFPIDGADKLPKINQSIPAETGDCWIITAPSKMGRDTYVGQLVDVDVLELNKMISMSCVINEGDISPKRGDRLYIGYDGKVFANILIFYVNGPKQGNKTGFNSLIRIGVSGNLIIEDAPRAIEAFNGITRYNPTDNTFYAAEKSNS